MSRLSEIIVKVTTALGANESKMRWRLHRFKLWRTRSTRKAEVKSEQIRYAHKKCGACRALNDKDDKVCSSCGEPLRWRISLMFERAGIGGLASTSALLIALILVVHGVAIAAGRGPLEVRHLMVELRAHMVLMAGPEWMLVALPYIHTSIVGLLATGLAIFLIGQEIESLYGRWVMLAWFGLTSAAGGFGHHAMFSDKFVLGASTGLCGLIAVGAVAGHRLSSHAGRELRNLMIKWGIVCLAVLLLLQGNIVGELIAAALGALIGYAVKPSMTRGSLPLHVMLGTVGAALVLGGAATAGLELAAPNLWSGY